MEQTLVTLDRRRNHDQLFSEFLLNFSKDVYFKAAMLEKLPKHQGDGWYTPYTASAQLQMTRPATRQRKK